MLAIQTATVWDDPLANQSSVLLRHLTHNTTCQQASEELQRALSAEGVRQKNVDLRPTQYFSLRVRTHLSLILEVLKRG
jgi:hypothetical protein